MNDHVDVTSTDGPKPSGGTGSELPPKPMRDALPVHADLSRSSEDREPVDVNKWRQAFNAAAGDGRSFDNLVDEELKLRLASVEQGKVLTEALRENDDAQIDARVCDALAAEARLQVKLTQADNQRDVVMRQNASQEAGPYREVPLPDSVTSDGGAPDSLLADLISDEGAAAVQHLAKAYQAAKELAGARPRTGAGPTAEAIAAKLADDYRQIVLGTKEQTVNPGREEAWKLVAGLLEEQTANPPKDLGVHVRPLLSRVQAGLDEAYQRQRSAAS